MQPSSIASGRRLFELIARVVYLSPSRPPPLPILAKTWSRLNDNPVFSAALIISLPLRPNFPAPPPVLPPAWIAQT